MSTLKVQVSSEGFPVPSALVRLTGNLRSLGAHPDATLAVRSMVTWTREISDFSGTRWNCWQKHVAQDVVGVTWQEFREQVLVHNPSLRNTDGRFEANQLYFLPENCLPANTAPLVVWEREVTGTGGTLWDCWQQHVRGKVLGLSWSQFSAQFGTHNSGWGGQGARLLDGQAYQVPATLGVDALYLAAYTGSDGSCHWDGLEPGFYVTYELTVHADGYVTLEQEIVIQDDGEVVVETELLPAPDDRAMGFVEVKKDKAGVARFFLNDRAFPFIGVNLRALLHYGGDEWQHHNQEFLGASQHGNVDQQLQHAQQMGVRVVRVFVASKHVPAEVVGNRLQDVLNRCQAMGLYVIPAFTDLYNDTPLHPQGDDEFYTFTSAEGKVLLNGNWFKGEYTKNYMRLVEHLVSRFASHPNIFAWEIGNELKLDNQAQEFKTFVHNVAQRIRQLDRNHMITTGMISTHHVHMKHELDLQRQLYASPNLNFLTVHAYNRHMDSEKPENDDPRRDQKIHKNDDSQLAREVGKPFIVEEAGIDAGKGTKRDAAIADDMRAWFDRGAQGYMQWGFMATDFNNGDGDENSGMDRGKFHDDWDELFRTYRDKANDLAAQAGSLSPAPNQPVVPPAAKPAASAGFKAGQTVFTTTTVKLRESPDASSEANVKTKVPGGTGVTILGESKAAGGFIWWKVRAGSQEGWMAQASGNTALLSLT